MNATLKDKNERVEKNISDLILVSQILFNEQRIHKNTYDRLYQGLDNIKLAIPTPQDHLADLISNFDPRTMMDGTSTKPVDVLTGIVTLNGKKKMITVREVF